MKIRRSSAGALIVRRSIWHLALTRWMYGLSALVLTVSSATALMWNRATPSAYAAPGDPVISSVSPGAGPTGGGNAVTINGSNFQSGIKFEAMGSGGATNCGISNGKAYCWGSGTFGQLGDGSSGIGNDKSSPVAVDTSGVLSGVTLTQIDISYGHTCAIDTVGKVYCWGNNSNGQLGNGTTTNSSVPVAVTTIEAGGGALPAVTKIATGNTHTCAITTGQKVYCWGQNDQGQIGNGLNGATNRTLPAMVLQSRSPITQWNANVTDIDGGYGYSCAVADGKAYCWGWGQSGRLGAGGTTRYNYPTLVQTTNVNANSELGDDKTVTHISSSEGGASQVAHTCAITTESTANAYCWGSNNYGQLGNGTTSNAVTPKKVTGILSSKKVSDISDGGSHTCAITTDTLAYCWGFGRDGRLGTGDTNNQSSPTAIVMSGELSGLGLTRIFATYGTDYFVTEPSHSCGLATDNGIYCWGSGGSGQMGNGSTVATNAAPTTSIPPQAPISVKFGSTYSESIVSTSSTQIVAIAPHHTEGAVDITVTRAGRSASLPASYTYDSPLPSLSGISPASGPSAGGQTVTISGTNLSLPMTQVSTGQTHSCAIASGKAYCWGMNSNGQLGDGTTTDSNTPVAVSTSGVLSGKVVTDVSVGSHYTCVIASGKAYCWGMNLDRQLGDGTQIQRLSPVAVTDSGVLSGKVVTGISARASHVCAVAEATVYCWGYNSVGQLGDGTTTNSSIPVAVSTSGVLSGKVVTDVSVGQNHSCVVADSKVYCWGQNTSGQLGNSTTTNSSIPVAVSTSGVLSGKVVTGISSGYVHTCTIATATVYCWGANGSGQLGNNSTTDSSIPVAVSTSGVLSGKAISNVSTGSWHSCASAASKAYCWGFNGNGRLGDGTSADKSTPVAVVDSGELSGKIVSSTSANFDHTCAIANSRLYCWGYNGNGQFGTGTMSETNTTALSALPMPALPTVSIGGTVSSGVSFASHDQITATTPSHSAGLVSTSVTRADTRISHPYRQLHLYVAHHSTIPAALSRHNTSK